MSQMEPRAPLTAVPVPLSPSIMIIVTPALMLTMALPVASKSTE